MRCFGNTLFLRALTEGENLNTLHRQGAGEASSREAAAARSELASMTEEGMQNFFQQTLLPMFKGGNFPRPVNGEHEEWACTVAVWEDPHHSLLSYVCKLYHVTSFDTNMEFVFKMVMLCVL